MDEFHVGVILTFGFVIFIIYGFAYSIVARDEKKKERLRLERARQNYQNGLEQLKSAPTNPDLKQTVLELGRHYSALSREAKGQTIFDEVALMNDLNAATAGAVTKKSIEERLVNLSELKSKGVIDEKEYDAKRKQILDEV